MSKFAHDLWERVGNTAWQAAGAAILVWLENGTDPISMDWKIGLQFAANAAILAIAKSLFAKKVGNSENASLSSKV